MSNDCYMQEVYSKFGTSVKEVVNAAVGVERAVAQSLKAQHKLHSQMQGYQNRLVKKLRKENPGFTTGTRGGTKTFNKTTHLDYVVGVVTRSKTPLTIQEVVNQWVKDRRTTRNKGGAYSVVASSLNQAYNQGLLASDTVGVYKAR